MRDNTNHPSSEGTFLVATPLASGVTSVDRGLVFHVFFAGSGLAIRNKMSPWQGWPGSQFGGSDRSLRSEPWATR
jgi:hypothetical protein